LMFGLPGESNHSSLGGPPREDLPEEPLVAGPLEAGHETPPEGVEAALASGGRHQRVVTSPYAGSETVALEAFGRGPAEGIGSEGFAHSRERKAPDATRGRYASAWNATS
jgi:hypothetical protein